MVSLDDLKFVIFSGTGENAPMSTLTEAYRTWKLVWSKAFLELDGNGQIFSDGFTRQTKIGAIFYKDICVSLAAFREADFNYIFQREDSLLNSWDDDAYKILTSDGKRVSICSYLSVHPEFRGFINTDVTFKLIMVHLCARVLLDSSCDVMTGTMRCNRGTDKSAYSAGATFIKKASMHNVEVDLVGFYKKHILANLKNYTHPWAEVVWANRIDYTKLNPAALPKAA